jgi:hypothetical protein
MLNQLADAHAKQTDELEFRFYIVDDFVDAFVDGHAVVNLRNFSGLLRRPLNGIDLPAVYNDVQINLTDMGYNGENYVSLKCCLYNFTTNALIYPINFSYRRVGGFGSATWVWKYRLVLDA